MCCNPKKVHPLGCPHQSRDFSLQRANSSPAQDASVPATLFGWRFFDKRRVVRWGVRVDQQTLRNDDTCVPLILGDLNGSSQFSQVILDILGIVLRSGFPVVLWYPLSKRRTRSSYVA